MKQTMPKRVSAMRIFMPKAAQSEILENLLPYYGLYLDGFNVQYVMSFCQYTVCGC